MHYLLLTFSLILHYLYRYICILNVFIYVYGQLSAIKKMIIMKTMGIALLTVTLQLLLFQHRYIVVVTILPFSVTIVYNNTVSTVIFCFIQLLLKSLRSQ